MDVNRVGGADWNLFEASWNPPFGIIALIETYRSASIHVSLQPLIATESRSPGEQPALCRHLHEPASCMRRTLTGEGFHERDHHPRRHENLL
jgi:hypothetical protein